MYYFIVNPNARSGKGKKVWNRVREALNAENIVYEAFFTSKRCEASELAREAAEREDAEKIIVAMGGDGTISEVLNGIWDHPEVTFAYIPIGSGNDFARGLGISSKGLQALEGILHKNQQIKLYPGRMAYDGQVRHFGGSMGIGFDAAVCVGVEKLPVKALLNRLGLGKFTYLGVALKLLITSSCDKMKIRLDGETVYRFHKVLFMCAMNGPYEGGGYKFAPEASVDDGLLHVCVASDIPVWKRFFLIPKAAKGKHVGFKGIYTYTCKKVEILSQKPKAIHGDGEPGGPVTKITVSVESEPISMIY